ncbi:hypothetical protein ZWY2020_045302 [Hordeum vulgare]|nr:hypothetical protein ZWY2020_045302 [Hordeum vulgare]
MAAGNQRKCLFVVMKDKKPDYFVYGINIEHMFQSGPSRGAAIEIRSLPSPMGQIPKPLADPERIDFALAGDGALGWRQQPQAHRLVRHEPSGEDCTLLIQDAGGTRLRLDCSSSSWRTLPEPPPDFRSLNGFQIKCQLTAYFTAGARIWVSAEKRGTYSFHTVRRQWRKEGDWQLPFHHRAVFVPELDNLCFGLSSKDRCLMAVDVRQSPPVVRYNWEGTFPSWARDNGNLCGLMPEGSLVYLGDGRFCIAWTVLMIDNVDGHTHYFLHLMAVQLIRTSSTGSGKKHLRMVKRGVCCYEMPSHGLMAHVF